MEKEIFVDGVKFKVVKNFDPELGIEMVEIEYDKGRWIGVILPMLDDRGIKTIAKSMTVGTTGSDIKNEFLDKGAILIKLVE